MKNSQTKDYAFAAVGLEENRKNFIAYGCILITNRIELFPWKKIPSNQLKNQLIFVRIKDLEVTERLTFVPNVKSLIMTISCWLPIKLQILVFFHLTFVWTG